MRLRVESKSTPSWSWLLPLWTQSWHTMPEVFKAKINRFLEEWEQNACFSRDGFSDLLNTFGWAGHRSIWRLDLTLGRAEVLLYRMRKSLRRVQPPLPPSIKWGAKTTEELLATPFYPTSFNMSVISQKLRWPFRKAGLNEVSC